MQDSLVTYMHEKRRFQIAPKNEAIKKERVDNVDSYYADGIKLKLMPTSKWQHQEGVNEHRKTHHSPFLKKNKDLM